MAGAVREVPDPWEEARAAADSSHLVCQMNAVENRKMISTEDPELAIQIDLDRTANN